METLMDEVCDVIHNYFAVRDEIHEGTYTVENGGLTLDFLQSGQYFRVMGSVFNDGVWQYPTTGMQTETFTGTIVPMAVPSAFVHLIEEIGSWMDAYGSEASVSPYTSESFNNYSYTRATATNTDGSSTPAGWQNIFGSRLNRWRRLP